MYKYIAMFWQVEDKRVAAEKRLMSMKTEHETLKKQFSLTREHLHKVKVSE